MKTKKIIAIIAVLAVLTSINFKEEKETIYETETPVQSYATENSFQPTPNESVTPTPELTEEPFTPAESETPVISSLPSASPAIETPVVSAPVVQEEPSNGEEEFFKLIALTFDDGPGPYTSELIEVLNEYNAHASFFVVGSRLNSYEEELNQIIDSGNEIGIHTYSHKSYTTLGVEGTLEELRKTRELLDNMKIEYSNFIRPPYGNLNSDLKSLIPNPFILWNVDSEDWKSKNAESVRDAILKGVSEGNIILLHDIYKSTLEGIKLALPLLDKEYRFVTVGELAESNEYTLENGHAYYSLKK